MNPSMQKLGCVIAAMALPLSSALFAAPVASSAESAVSPPLADGEQWGPENDAQTEEILTDTLQSLMQRSRNDAFVRRDAHPKQHGCVRANVHVDSTALDPALRVGIFAAGAPVDYQAWVRFSNGNPAGATTPDIDKDIRGMALKLMNVADAAGGSQDFLLLTSKSFFARDGADYLAQHRALAGSHLQQFWYAVTHPRNLSIIWHGLDRAANPLQLAYYSAVPYKLGPGSMKFQARPCATQRLSDALPDDPAPDFLRQRLVSTLASREACFDLLLQPNRDPANNPIENANQEWDEAVSPFIKVATIRIPQQGDIDTPERRNFCENLSFNPWHSTEATRPLGQINRIRQVVYPAVTLYRHRYNHVPALEPHSFAACSGETAALCRTPQH